MNTSFVVEKMLLLIKAYPTVHAKLANDDMAHLAQFWNTGITCNVLDYLTFNLPSEQTLTHYVDRLIASRSHPYPFNFVPTELPGASSGLEMAFSLLNKTLSLLAELPEENNSFYTSTVHSASPLDASMLCAHVMHLAQNLGSTCVDDIAFASITFPQIYQGKNPNRAEIEIWNIFQKNLLQLHGLIDSAIPTSDTSPDPEMTPLDLHAAITNKSIDEIRQIIALPQSTLIINSRDISNRTPLHLAAIKNNTAIVQLLLKHGADITLTDNIGMTPLGVAMICGRLNAAKVLIESGARYSRGDIWGTHSSIKNGEYTNKNEAGLTLLHCAAKLGFTEGIPMIATACQQYGARLNETTFYSGSTALHIAVMFGHVDTARALMISMQGCGYRIDKKDAKGMMAKDYAASQEMKDLFKEVPRSPTSVLGKRSTNTFPT